MDRLNHICLRATYNEWMNGKIYNVLLCEFPFGVSRDNGAPIDSIVAMLNHLIIVDTLWLKRFTLHPANYSALAPIVSSSIPEDLNQIVSDDLATLHHHREMLDSLICELAHSISRIDLDYLLCYKSKRGAIVNGKFFNIIMYFFNYQSHIREKILDLMRQADIDIDATELIVPVPSGIEL